MVKEKMENKYLNEAIIGNKNMIATFTSKGELQRLYFPSKDNKQYIKFYLSLWSHNKHPDISSLFWLALAFFISPLSLYALRIFPLYYPLHLI